MKAQQLLDDLARKMGLPALPLDTNHCARLNFNGALSVNFESDELSGHLHLYSELGELPLRGREAIYRELLSGNVFGLKTGGAALSLDSRSCKIQFRAPRARQRVFPGDSLSADPSSHQSRQRAIRRF